MNDGAHADQSGCAAAGAGAMLLAERRRQGLSLGDISRQLKLSVRQVEALERDDFAGFRGPVFVHGFIRNYAKLLALEPDALIRAADRTLTPPAPAAEAVAVPAARATRSARSVWPAAAGVLLVVLVAATLYLGSKGGSAPKLAPPITVPLETQALAPPVAEKRPAPAKIDPAPKAIASAEAGEPVQQITVRMVFDQESWVEIKDRSGNTIFGQLNPAGSRRSVNGEPPLAVVVGHAVGVQMFRNGEVVDLAPHTRVDVARLTLE